MLKCAASFDADHRSDRRGLAARARSRPGARLLPAEDDTLGLLEQVAVGFAAISALLLLLGAAVFLRPLPIGALLLSVALYAAPELRRLPRRVRPLLPRLHSPLEAAAAAVFVAAAFFLIVLALAPPVDWDTLMYHLDVPAEWLAAGRIYLPADNLHAAHVGMLHALYLPLLATASPAAPAVLNGALALLFGSAVVGGANRLFRRESAALAGGWLWGTGAVLLIASTARVDVSLTLYLTLAHLALIRAADGGDAERELPRVALLLGCALGIKLLAVVYGVALVPLALWLLVRLPPARRLPVLALSTVAALVPALPWLIKNWLLVGAPLYPLGIGPQLEPWLAALYARHRELDWQLVGALTEVRETFSPWLALVAPGRLTIEWEASFYRFSPALLFVLLWIRDRRAAVVNALLGPALLYVAIVLARSPTTNLRYLLPAVPALTIVAASLLASFTTRRGVLLLALTIGILPAVPAANAWLTRTSALPHALGLVSAEAYRESHFDVGARSLAAAVRLVDEGVPPGGRVLLLFEARGFAFSSDVIQDNRLNNWPLFATLAGEGCLEEAGFTHVLVNRGAIAYYARRGLDPGQLRWQEFGAFRTLSELYRMTQTSFS